MPISEYFAYSPASIISNTVGNPCIPDLFPQLIPLSDLEGMNLFKAFFFGRCGACGILVGRAGRSLGGDQGDLAGRSRFWGQPIINRGGDATPSAPSLKGEERAPPGPVGPVLTPAVGLLSIILILWSVREWKGPAFRCLTPPLGAILAVGPAGLCGPFQSLPGRTREGETFLRLRRPLHPHSGHNPWPSSCFGPA